MNYFPEPDFKAHLEEQGLPVPEGGFLLDADELIATVEQFTQTPAHAAESADDVRRRAFYFLIWKHYGVPEKSGGDPKQAMTAQRIVDMHSSLRKLHKEIGPAVDNRLEGIDKAVRDTAGILRDSFASEQGSTRTVIRAMHSVWLKEAVATREQENAMAREFRAAAALGWKGAKAAFWTVVALLILNALLMALSLSAHAQVELIQFQDGTGTTIGTFPAVLKIKCGSNVTCSKNGLVVTIAASGSLGSAFGSITAGTNAAALVMGTGGTLDFSGTGTINANKLMGQLWGTATTSGQIPIYNQASNTFVPGDPLVQGLVAEGIAIGNPVTIGGKTAGGLNKAFAVDASGFITANINGTVPVSGTFFQATQPVSGTFFQATQPVSLASVPSHAVTNAGTFAVQVTSAPTTAVTGTFFQATQPVSAVSLPLPTGASTAAKQPALGVAGTASTDVITVQGIAAMTALKVDGSGVTQPVSGTFWQATQPVSLASVPSHAVTNAGTFAVQVSSAPTTAVTGTFWQATQPVSGTVSITANSAVNIAQINGITPLMGNGATGTGSPRVTIASDNTPFGVNATLQTSANVIGHVICDSGCTPGGSFADNAAFTFGTTAINTMGAVVDDIGTNVATENSAAAPRMSTNRVLFMDLKNTQANTTALLVTGTAGTFPVTGTFWQATQPVSGTFWQATQPVSAVSLPLPTGAATLAKQPALGTAGTASADVITVQGIASMTALKVDNSAVTQPVSGTFWQATQPVSIATMPSTPVTGTFWQATQPVSLASVPSHAVTNAGTFATQATLAAETTKVIGTVRTADGSGNLTYVDPCQRSAKTYLPINIVTATTTRIIAPSVSNKVYFCSFTLYAAGTTNVALVEGTGGTCGTGTAGIAGGTTAATGWNLVAQTGLAWGSGGYAVMASAGTNVDVCLITSAAIQINGHAAYVLAP